MKAPNVSFIASVASIALIVALTSVWMAKPGAFAMATLPAGSKITIRLTQSLASDQNKPGHQFEATLNDPVLIDGMPAIPKGTKVGGKVVNVRASGGLQNVAQLRLTLNSIQLDGRAYELQTNDVVRYGPGHSNRTLEFVGGGKGIPDGLPLGSGVDIYAAAFTEESPITLPAGMVLSFKLIEPLRVPIKK